MSNPKVVRYFFVWLAIVLLAFNGYISLWDQDEAAYAGFAKNMLDSGDLLIPDFDWSFIHRKPPFHFWMIALAYKIFGINEFAVRFFPALAVWLSVFLIYFKGKKLTDEITAFRASVVLGTSAFIIMLGKMAVTDAWMLVFYTLAGLYLWEFLKFKTKKSLLVFYIAIALSFLVKGPPMLVFDGMLFLLLLIFWPEKKTVFQTHPWFYGILSLIPFGLWIYLAYKTNPEFVKWWTDWYILKRMHSAVLGQTGPPGTYLLLFFFFFMPFIPFLLRSFGYIFRKNKNPDLLYLVLWFISGWLIYELLPSKLPAYVLAAYPALSFLIAMAMNEFEEKQSKIYNWGFMILIVISSILLTGLIVALFIPDFRSFRTELSVLAYLLLVFVFLSVISFKHYKKSHAEKSFYFLFINAFFWISGLFFVVLPLTEKYKNATKQTALLIKSQGNQNLPVIVMNDFGKPPSLIFYLKTLNPDKKIIIKDDPEEKIRYLKQHLSQQNAIWIINEKLASQVDYPGDKYKIYRIQSLNTGKVGKNDYIILIPND